jgi:hypothetical protein
MHCLRTATDELGEQLHRLKEVEVALPHRGFDLRRIAASIFAEQAPRMERQQEPS